MENSFKDKVVFITGGASGIGLATAQAFAESGARVIIADINSEIGEAIVNEERLCGSFQCLDVTDEAGWIHCFRHVIEEFGRIDVVINSAGVGVRSPIDEFKLEDWNHVINTNLTGTFLGCKHSVRTMKQSGGKGSIVNVSSVAAHWGTEDSAAYCASKAGVKLLTQCVALYCAKEKLDIRCNSVEPTSTDTALLDPMAAELGGRDRLRTVMGNKIPLGRMATAAEIAGAILFLAGSSASMITGIGLPVDGGTMAGMTDRYSDN